MKTKIFFLFSATILFLPIMALAETDHLVISQVQTDSIVGTGGTEDDWVELYNPTQVVIDLTGWSIQKSSATGGSFYRKVLTGIIPVHGYFLIVRNDANTQSNLKAIADVLAAGSSFSLSDNNTIYLVANNEDVTGNLDSDIVDMAGFGTSTIFEGAPALNPPAGGSIIRAGDDTNNNNADFVKSTAIAHNSKGLSLQVSSPPPPPIENPPAETPPADTPPASDSTPPPAESAAPAEPTFSKDIFISEILPNPDGADNGEEWIELYNNSQTNVDLSGWSIDDESADGSIGKDSYVFPESSTIKAMSYLPVNLPEEVFALNNTGGDAVRLFWPDQTLTTSVSYTGNAKDDTTYAMKSPGIYEWTTLVTKGITNQFPDNFLANVTSNAETKIKFNEILPNPKGPDSGGEWVEVKNFGTEPIYIHNWILDDGADSDPIGSSAYKIQSPTISPGGLAVIVIPAGKFAMNNTTDTVRLFNANKVLIDSITYEGAKEGLSYALIDSKWVWADSTPNAVNDAIDETKLAPPASIVINELFPDPDKTNQQEEFIELLNTGSAEVDLSGFKLADLATVYKLESKIKPGEFLVIKKSESKIALNNYGKETVTLTDAKDEIVSAVEYEDAPQDQSYNLNLAGSYVWSARLTPGTANLVSTQASLGQVKGATLPRTGNDSPINQSTIFVLWAIIWYIYISFTNNKKHTYEQTRID